VADRRIYEEGEEELLKHDEEIGRLDMLSYIVWAALLLWGGITFLSIKNGWLETFFRSNFIVQIMSEGAVVLKPRCMWSIIMLGAGLILLVEVAARLLIPVFPYQNGGSLVLAVVFIGVGLRNIFGWDYLWAFFLVSVSASILLDRFMRRRS